LRYEADYAMTEHLIFGVDGLNHDFVQKMIEKGQMRTFEKLQRRRETYYGELESFICEGYQTPHTGPNWTSLYTGLKPKEHGITSGGWNDGDSKFHALNTVWGAIGGTGKSLYLNGMPMTYKAKPINGKMISGFVSPTIKSMWDKCVYPDEFRRAGLPDDYIEYTSSYVAKVKTDGAKPSTDTESFWNEIKSSETSRLRIFNTTYDDEHVVAYGTTLVDKIGHVSGIGTEENFDERAYILLDEILSTLIDTCEPDRVTIISDHGFSEFSHDLNGYCLDSTGRELDTIFDFAPYMRELYDLPHDDSFFGPNEQDTDRITQEEEDDIKDQLKNMGYF